MHISEINIYPIKSLKGIPLDSALVEERGLQYDRRWMLTDTENRFLTQREFPSMATIAVRVENGELRVESEGQGAMSIPFEPEIENRKPVTIWKSVCDGLLYDRDVNEWFSDAIGTKCQLVYMPDDSRRRVNPLFNKHDDVVSFADGYPLMLLSEASLDDLNYRIDRNENADEGVRVPLPMKRFRPNLVVSGSDPFAEDNWQRIRVGEAIFRSTKPCERCVITTIDPSTGEFAGKEPLRTLASFRKARDVMPDLYATFGVDPNGVLFGQNLIAESIGATIQVGDQVEVIA